MNRFPPLAPQEHRPSRRLAVVAAARALPQALPQYSMPWLELGIAAMLALLIHQG